MGLSNGERFCIICRNADDLTRLAGEFRDYTTEPLKPLLRRLWYDVLREPPDRLRCGLGDFDGSTMKDETLLGAALVPHGCGFGDAWESPDEYKSYETLASFLTVARLLPEEESRVVRVFDHCQEMAYAIARYDDAFRRTLRPLHRTVCSLLGHCYHLFRTSCVYAHAWMLSVMAGSLYEYNPDDVLYRWWTDACVPHRVKVDRHKYKDVLATFKAVQFRLGELTLPERLDLSLFLAGPSRSDYEHGRFLDLLSRPPDRPRPRAW